MLNRASPFSSLNVAMQRLPGALRANGYRFVTISPASHAVVNARPANALAATVEDVFGWSRPFRRDVLDAVLFDVALEAGVLTAAGDSGGGLWRSLVRVSTLEGMLLLHSAFPTDGADAVFFGPDTYRFADAILRHLAGCGAQAESGTKMGRVLDLGCGTGAGGLVVAMACPDADILLTDVNDAALNAARLNAAAAASNVECRRSDLFEAVDGDFDLVVANPPYLVDAGQRQYRHGGGALGADLSLRIAEQSLQRLRPGGCLLLYTGSAIVGGRDLFYEAVAVQLEECGYAWRYREADPDVFGEELGHGVYAQADRIAAVVLTVERPA